MLKFLLLLTFIPSSVFAADFTKFVLDEDTSVPIIIHLTGEIVDGDAEAFERAIEGYHKVTLILESPGGLVREAFRIGATLRQHDFATMVVDNGQCYSACGLIWLASERRYMSASSQIGFHAAYRQIGDYVEESGEANAVIGSYLTHLGLRIEAIRFFTRSGPREFELLTPLRARALGIDIYLQSGGGAITPPWENPTVDRMAEEKVSLMVAGSVCEELFGQSFDQVDDITQSLDARGTFIVGEFWHELWLREINRYKPSGPEYTLAHACLRAESVTRRYGYRLVTGPGFDCLQASTATEHTICNDVEMQVKDRVMGNLYSFILHSNNPNVSVANFRGFHRDWLNRRNSCGDNSRCLHAAYDEVIALYGAIHLDT